MVQRGVTRYGAPAQKHTGVCVRKQAKQPHFDSFEYGGSSLSESPQRKQLTGHREQPCNARMLPRTSKTLKVSFSDKDLLSGFISLSV